MRSLLITLFVGLAAIGSVAGDASSSQKPSGDAVSKPSPVHGSLDGVDKTEIPQIDLDGLKKLLLRDPKDTRPLLINFWATWCDPCREEFPDLVKIDTDYGAKNLNFIAISFDDVSEIKTEVPKFLKEMKATMPVVLLNVNDAEPAIHAVDQKWDGQLPATFLYDKDGKVVFRYFGRIKPDELRTAIDKAVMSGK